MTSRRGASTRGRGLIRLGNEIGHAGRTGAKQRHLESAEDRGRGGTLDATAIVKVKFTTNVPVMMVAAAFRLRVLASNGRKVPLELRNPNTPFVLAPPMSVAYGSAGQTGSNRNHGDFYSRTCLLHQLMCAIY